MERGGGEAGILDRGERDGQGPPALDGSECQPRAWGKHLKDYREHKMRWKASCHRVRLTVPTKTSKFMLFSLYALIL